MFTDTDSDRRRHVAAGVTGLAVAAWLINASFGGHLAVWVAIFGAWFALGLLYYLRRLVLAVEALPANT